MNNLDRLRERIVDYHNLEEGSLGEKRTNRKAKLALKRGSKSMDAEAKASTKTEPSTGRQVFSPEWHAKQKGTYAKIKEIHHKGERGGRWGTDYTSPTARKAERELAADYSQKHTDILKKSTERRNKKSPLSSDGYAYSPGFFYNRMRKHADSQGTRHPGDESGVARTSRLDKPIRRELKIKAKAERRLGPKPTHPSVQSAQTKARLKGERASREQEKQWDRESKLPRNNNPWA